MKTACSLALGLAIMLVLALAVNAEEKKKEVTLKGTLTCAKCDLKKESKCMTVLVVKDGDKETIYYLDDKAGKDNHKKICTEAKSDISVTGTVEDKDGKKTITVSKIDGL